MLWRENCFFTSNSYKNDVMDRIKLEEFLNRQARRDEANERINEFLKKNKRFVEKWSTASDSERRDIIDEVNKDIIENWNKPTSDGNPTT
jgi:hypothetical protein